ncbi:MAG: CatB-related O-acetyltransferase [Bacteroidia bacterium]|nr:CatB-related O-acetyltransferase [Bacteroidia bacterium]
MRRFWNYFVKFFKLQIFKRKWRKENGHNFTSVVNILPLNKLSVGNYTYGIIDAKFYGNSEEAIQIGHFCSIASNVTFIASGGHPYTNFSTYPFKKMMLSEASESLCKGKIVVGDDVWIGHGSIILSGVTIGQGAVIGAGSVVAKNVPPYSIFVGNRVLKMRFPPDIIEKLIIFDFSTLDKIEIGHNLELLYRNLDESFFSSDLYINHCTSRSSY